MAGAGYWAWRERHPPPGPYEFVARRLGERGEDFCDRENARTRLYLSRVIDLMRPRIRALWNGRKGEEFPQFKMEAVGPVFLRVSEPGRFEQGFDDSHWSWEEAAATYYRTQTDPAHPDTNQRWRDLDTEVRFLLERDVGRILRGRKYLPPERTPHAFRPSMAVRRKGKKAFVVRLDAGDFSGAEKKLEKIFSSSWSSPEGRVEVEWVRNDPAAYRLRADFGSSRSYVNHGNKSLVIANFAFTRTVAHELGHVLGFADHYYSVWNDRNCYYTQKSRLGDLMSNSEKGVVTATHWKILEKAYPLGAPPATGFSYFFPPPAAATKLAR